MPPDRGADFDTDLARAHQALRALEPARSGRIDLPADLPAVPPFPDAAAAFEWAESNADRLCAVVRDAVAAGHVVMASALLERLFWSLWVRGDVGALSETLEAASAVAIETDDAMAEMTLGNMLGLDYARRGDLNAARSNLSQAAAAASQIGNQVALAGALQNLATMARLGGHTREAIAAYEEVVEIKDAIGDKDVTLALVSLTSVNLELGDLDAAERAVGRARAIVEADSAPDGQPHQRLARVLYHSAQVAQQRGQAAQAITWLDRAMPIAERFADTDAVAHIAELRGLIAAEQGDAALADTMITRAGDIAYGDPVSDLAVSVLGTQGQIEAALQRYPVAVRHLEQTVHRARLLGARNAEAEALVALAGALRGAGEGAAADSTAREAMQLADDCEYGPLIERCRALLGER